MSDGNRKAWVVRYAGMVATGLAGSLPATGGTLPTPGCLDGGEPARVREVGPDLDLRLDDGRDIRLPGIDPADAGGAGSTAAASAATRTALARWLQGRRVTIVPLQPGQDRWGRTAALAFAAGPSTPPENEASPGERVSVAEAILDAGFGRARPDPLIRTCWPAFLADETRARLAGAGLWSNSSNGVLAAEDRAGLARRTGTMAVVEGRILRVVQGRARTYLSFAEDRSGFTVTIPRAVQSRLLQAGTVSGDWKGRRARVRGFLDDRFGLQIELTSLDQIEFIQP